MEAEEQVQENDMMADLSSAFEALNSEDEADDGLAAVSDTSEGPEAELEAEAEVSAEPVPDETAEPVEGGETQAESTDEGAGGQHGDEPPPSLSSQEARDAWKDANPALKEEFKRFDQRLEGYGS